MDDFCNEEKKNRLIFSVLEKNSKKFQDKINKEIISIESVKEKNK
jgi:hypothetical protein